MNDLNPELQSQIDDLAQLCCDTLARTGDSDHDRIQPLIEALVRGGYDRISNVNLQVRLEDAVVEKCREHAIHRRDEVTGIAGQIQAEFSKALKWKTNQPQPEDGTKPANISSNTDA